MRITTLATEMIYAGLMSWPRPAAVRMSPGAFVGAGGPLGPYNRSH